MKMTTQEVSKKIKELYQIIGKNQQIDIEKYFSQLHFQIVSPDYEHGVYIFSDEKGYHWAAVGDRGGIDEEIVSKDIDEIFLNSVGDLCQRCQ